MQEQASTLKMAPDYRCGSAVSKQLAAMNQAPRFRPCLVCPSHVYVAGGLAGRRQRSPLAFLTLGAKVRRRLLPIGKTVLGNLLTEDVLQQILSCSPTGSIVGHMGCTRTHVHTRTQYGFPVVIPQDAPPQPGASCRA